MFCAFALKKIKIFKIYFNSIKIYRLIPYLSLTNWNVINKNLFTNKIFAWKEIFEEIGLCAPESDLSLGISVFALHYSSLFQLVSSIKSEMVTVNKRRTNAFCWKATEIPYSPLTHCRVLEEIRTREKKKGGDT